MKILYVGNDAKRDSWLGYCPNAQWIKRAFETLGHDVLLLDEATETPQSVLQYVANWKPNLLLLEEGRLKGDHQNDEKTNQTVINGDIQEVLNCSGVPSVVWLTNIFWGIMRRQIEIKNNPIFRADIVFSTDGGNKEKWKEAGINHHVLRQGVDEQEAYIGKPIYPTKAEVVFIGSIYEEIWPYRKKLVDFLQKTYGNRFAHVGQRGEVRHDDLNNLLATVKIVIGDSVYSPHYWSNRIYEVLGRGGFLIHPAIPGLDKEFTPGVHYVPYTMGDFDQLKRKIDYYLIHDEERCEIQQAGHTFCKTHYTYTKRVENMLELLKQNNII